MDPIPLDELSLSQLDELVAQHVLKKPPVAGISYSDSLDSFWGVELRLEELNLGTTYGDWLAKLTTNAYEKKMAEDNLWVRHPPMNWLVAHATAPQKCVAALLTVGAVKWEDA